MANQDDLAITGQGDPAFDRSIQRKAADGELTRVGDGIYVDESARPAAEILYSKWAVVLAKYAPGAVLSGRSAIRMGPIREVGADGRPTGSGWVFATHQGDPSRKRISLPGLEIRSNPGPGALPGDFPFLGVTMPSEARKLLDNLKPSKTRDGPSRTAGAEAVELEVERLLTTGHETALRALYQRAEEISDALGTTKEFEQLKAIIGAVSGTREAKLQSSQVAARRRKPDPYDPDCLERLKLLASGLGRLSLPDVSDPHLGEDLRSCTAFIEAYFTNYIEGTRFLVEKAKRIVFENEEAEGRPADGRDVTQTFAQVANLLPGASLANTYQEFRDEIRERNRMLLDGRPEARGGLFKSEPNRAGNTLFVLPEFVEGTLKEGFEIMGGLTHPFARGLFAHSLIVMVHPFNDGNGRVSRIMMSKALVSGGQSRAIVPTIFRNDYIAGVRALNDPAGARVSPIIRAFQQCQATTAKIAEADLRQTIELWASTHAFLEDERDARFTSPDVGAKIEWRSGVPAPSSYWSSLELSSQIDDLDAGDVSSRFGR